MSCINLDLVLVVIFLLVSAMKSFSFSARGRLTRGTDAGDEVFEYRISCRHTHKSQKKPQINWHSTTAGTVKQANG